jgi:hypothetical protein
MNVMTWEHIKLQNQISFCYSEVSSSVSFIIISFMWTLVLTAGLKVTALPHFALIPFNKTFILYLGNSENIDWVSHKICLSYYYIYPQVRHTVRNDNIKYLLVIGLYRRPIANITFSAAYVSSICTSKHSFGRYWLIFSPKATHIFRNSAMRLAGHSLPTAADY